MRAGRFCSEDAAVIWIGNHCASRNEVNNRGKSPKDIES